MQQSWPLLLRKRPTQGKLCGPIWLKPRYSAQGMTAIQQNDELFTHNCGAVILGFGSSKFWPLARPLRLTHSLEITNTLGTLAETRSVLYSQLYNWPGQGKLRAQTNQSKLGHEEKQELTHGTRVASASDRCELSQTNSHKGIHVCVYGRENHGGRTSNTKNDQHLYNEMNLDLTLEHLRRNRYNYTCSATSRASLFLFSLVNNETPFNVTKSIAPTSTAIATPRLT